MEPSLASSPVSRHLSQQRKISGIFYPLLIFILLIAINFQGKTQNTVFVNHAATGANNGSSWANAYTALQDAIDAAVPGDHIWVAKGVYLPTQKQGGTSDRHKTFYIHKNVEIYGGFDGTEASLELRDVDSNVTILSGDLDGNDANNDGNNIGETYTDIAGANAHHVVWFRGVAQGARLDGFVITGGDKLQTDGEGGGILNVVETAGESSNPVIAHCRIVGNKAERGGGISNRGGGSFGIGNDFVPYGNVNAAILNCFFSGNFAEIAGGALYNLSGNYDTANVRVIGCAFEKNISGSGGAVFNGCIVTLPLSQPEISNCLFYDNVAESAGGGIFNSAFRGKANPVLSNCIFYNNSVNSTPGSYGGGAVANSTTTFGPKASPVFVNSTFVGNTAANGSAVYSHASFSAYTEPIFTNCIFWDNPSANGKVIEQTIAMDDNSPYIGLSDFRIKYSIFEGNVCPPLVHCDSTVLFNHYPMFSNATNGDFHLLPGSPAIDAGDNNAVLPGVDTDLDGNARIFNATGKPVARVDMGAYEVNIIVSISGLTQASRKLSVTPNPVVSDAYFGFYSDAQGTGRLNVFSLSGQWALEQDIPVHLGANLFPFSMESLPAGVYAVQIIHVNNGTTSGIFVKSN